MTRFRALPEQVETALRFGSATNNDLDSFALPGKQKTLVGEARLLNNLGGQHVEIVDDLLKFCGAGIFNR